jgi:hypothetical protein
VERLAQLGRAGVYALAEGVRRQRRACALSRQRREVGAKERTRLRFRVGMGNSRGKARERFASLGVVRKRDAQNRPA